MLTLLYLSNERTDIQSTVRLLCTKLKHPTVLEMRQLKRLLRYVKGTEDMSTVFEMRDSNDRREQLVKRLEVYTDSDWASDQVTWKSTSGAVIMTEGMKLHAHSRGQASVALGSCEAEVMAASVGIKEALLLQEMLMFAGLGHYEIEIKVDSSAAQRILPSTRCWTHHAHRFENLVVSRLDCCGRCEIEESTENTELGRHVDAKTMCEGTGGIFTVDESQELQ